jgi:hypothetical protein
MLIASAVAHVDFPVVPFLVDSTEDGATRTPVATSANFERPHVVGSFKEALS